MKFEKLESLRGFAAIYVVIYHLLMHTQFKVAGVDMLFVFRFGQEAVILFFLLSGFVIKYSFERSKNKSFKDYFLKRFTRIYIPLFFVLVLSYVLYCIGARKLESPQFGDLVANLFMLQDVGVKPNVFFPPYMGNAPLWSLAYEWWFYMFFYLLYKFCDPKHLNKVVAIIVLLGGVSLIIYPFFLNRFLFYFGIWWVGVEFARLYLQKQEITLRSARFSLLLMTSCIGLTLVNMFVNWPTDKHVTIGLSPVLEFRHFGFAAVVSVGAIIWHRFKWIGFNTLFGRFAIFSPITYTIYISHWPLLMERNYLSVIQSDVLQISIAIMLTIMFSYLLELKIYPPLKNWVFAVAYKTDKISSPKKQVVQLTTN